ncbi:hypothetical protein KI387_031724, partial [Taxus chinensis]
HAAKKRDSNSLDKQRLHTPSRGTGKVFPSRTSFNETAPPSTRQAHPSMRQAHSFTREQATAPASNIFLHAPDHKSMPALLLYAGPLLTHQQKCFHGFPTASLPSRYFRRQAQHKKHQKRHAQQKKHQKWQAQHKKHQKRHAQQKKHQKTGQGTQTHAAPVYSSSRHDLDLL